MKKNPLLLSACLLALLCLLIPTTGCFKDPNTKPLKHYIIYSPVYGSKAAALASINGSASKTIDSVGKIYIKGAYIFVNEPEKGIHVIDNSNPSHPKQTAFLSIPGNQDIAIQGNTLYADMYTDLLAIDISDIHHAKVTGEIEKHFLGRYSANGFATMTDDMIAVDWQGKDTVMPSDRVVYPVFGGGCPSCMSFSQASTVPSASNSGTAGSMAKMVIINDYLYTIPVQHDLGIINISNAASPTLSSEMFAGFDLETIYPFQDKLFLGSSEGVFIFDVSTPATPVNKGTFTHGRACDPVVTDGKYAYVTLHAGSWCGGATNELDVVDVRDLSNPSLVKVYPMTKPMGLCKDGDLLFVSDGDNGVKVYNAANPSGLQLMQQVGNGQAYDVIAEDHRLLIVSNKGLYQYSYNKGNDLHLLSQYAITQ